MADVVDVYDSKIIQILLHDGRTPASQIAEQIGLSRPSVAERMEKLERSGLVRGTTVVVDPAAFGNSVTAFISARRQGKLDSKARKAFDALLRLDEILEAHSVAGDDCYLMKVRTNSIQALNEIVSNIGHEPLSMVTRTTIVMETYSEKVGGIDLCEARNAS